jgi:hypothetical protein
MLRIQERKFFHHKGDKIAQRFLKNPYSPLRCFTICELLGQKYDVPLFIP